MPGQGFLFGGTAHILSSGNVVDKVKPKFPLARGAIVAALWAVQQFGIRAGLQKNAARSTRSSSVEIMNRVLKTSRQLIGA